MHLDFKTHTNIVLTSTRLYRAFKSGEKWIIKQWLNEHIEDEVLHDAFAVLFSTISHRQAGWTLDTGRMFLKDYNAINQKPFHSKFSWQLSQALALSELHELVEHFFKIYVKDAYRQLFRIQPGRVPVRLIEYLSKWR